MKTSDCLRSETCFRIVVVICNYYNGPISVVPCRAKVLSLLHASILFRPQGAGRETGDLWWRRRVPPPGPQCLFHRPFIAIVGFPTH